MNVLIVHAHPEPKSFNGALKELTAEVLAGEGHEVRVSDLYAMGFEATAGPGDFLERADSQTFRLQTEQTHAHATGTFAADVQAEMEKVLWADFVMGSRVPSTRSSGRSSTACSTSWDGRPATLHRLGTRPRRRRATPPEAVGSRTPGRRTRPSSPAGSPGLRPATLCGSSQLEKSQGGGGAQSRITQRPLQHCL
jgi:hypothetical protein